MNSLYVSRTVSGGCVLYSVQRKLRWFRNFTCLTQHWTFCQLTEHKLYIIIHLIHLLLPVSVFSFFSYCLFPFSASQVSFHFLVSSLCLPSSTTADHRFHCAILSVLNVLFSSFFMLGVGSLVGDTSVINRMMTSRQQQCHLFSYLMHKWLWFLLGLPGLMHQSWVTCGSTLSQLNLKMGNQMLQLWLVMVMFPINSLTWTLDVAACI